MPTINVYFDEDTYIKLVYESVKQERKITALIKEAVRKWLKERMKA